MYVHQHLQVGVPYMVAATFANFHQLCPEKTAKPVCQKKWVLSYMFFRQFLLGGTKKLRKSLDLQWFESVFDQGS